MRLRHLKSSTVVVEDGGTSVLCDPWMLDGAFYGAWAHYPPVDERMGFETIDPEEGQPVLLSSEECFDLDEEAPSEEYPPVDRDRRQEYIRNVLAERSFAFESDDHPTLSELTDLLDGVSTHGRETRGDRLGERHHGAARPRRRHLDERRRLRDHDRRRGRYRRRLRPLQHPACSRASSEGPNAHFNDAQIGSHVGVETEPDVYERPLYYSMSYLHA